MLSNNEARCCHHAYKNQVALSSQLCPLPPTIMPLPKWPPALSPSQLEELHLQATTYALSHGLLYLPPGQQQPPIPSSAIHAPFALFPSPFPRTLFNHAQDLQQIYNVLYARVASDTEFLDQVLSAETAVGRVDEFVGALWKIWKEVRSEGLVQVRLKM